MSQKKSEDEDSASEMSYPAPESSCVSMKSDRSMVYPPNLSEAKVTSDLK